MRRVLGISFVVGLLVVGALVWWGMSGSTRRSEATAPPTVRAVADDPAVEELDVSSVVRSEAMARPVEGPPRVSCVVVAADGTELPIEVGHVVARAVDGLFRLPIEGGVVWLRDESHHATVVEMREGDRALELLGPGALVPGAVIRGGYPREQTLHVRDALTGAHLGDVAVWELETIPGEDFRSPPAAGLLAESATSPVKLPVGTNWKPLHIASPGYGPVSYVVDRTAPDSHVWMGPVGAVRVTVTGEFLFPLWRGARGTVQLILSSLHTSGKNQRIFGPGEYTMDHVSPGDYEIGVLVFHETGEHVHSEKHALSVVAGSTTEIVLTGTATKVVENLKVVLVLPPSDVAGVSGVELLHADVPGGRYRRWGVLGASDFGVGEGGTLEARTGSTRSGAILARDSRTGVWAEAEVIDPEASTTLVLDLTSTVAHTIVLGEGCSEAPAHVAWKYASDLHGSVQTELVQANVQNVEIHVLPLALLVSVRRGDCVARDVYVDLSNPAVPTTIALTMQRKGTWRTLQPWSAHGPIVCSNSLWHGLDFFDLTFGQKATGSRRFTQVNGTVDGEWRGAAEGTYQMQLAPGRYRVALRGATVGEMVVRGDEPTAMVEFTDLAALVGFL